MPELAWEMLEPLIQKRPVRFRWVLGDERYGRDSTLLDRLDAAGAWYCMEVPVSTEVWREWPRTEIPAWSGRGRPPRKERRVEGAPDPERADVIAARLPPEQWQAYRIKEGAKGPIIAEFACLRVVNVREGLPGSEVWLILRRSSKELKVYLSNAPAEVPVEELVRVTGMRWAIERCFEECKEELGMDHYEVRSWTGWHHHMTLTMLAHHFLAWVRQRLGGKSPGLTVSQAKLLLQMALPRKHLTLDEAVALILDIQRRNHRAYRSHRKRKDGLHNREGAGE
jgi:SRSO17 transposase